MPIYYAALALETARLAGELADGVELYMCSAQRMSQLAQAAREAASSHGRKPSDVAITMGLPTFVHDDLERAMSVARRRLAFYGSLPFYNRQMARAGFEAEAQAAMAAAQRGDKNAVEAAMSDRLLDSMALIGPPVRCLERLAAFRAAGAELPIIRPNEIDQNPRGYNPRRDQSVLEGDLSQISALMKGGAERIFFTRTLTRAALYATAAARPCIFKPEPQDRKGRGRPQRPRSHKAGGEQGLPRPDNQASAARTVDRAVSQKRARIGLQGGAGRGQKWRRSGAMAEEVYVGIDVSKAELVMAVRPSGERAQLANNASGIKQLVARLRELQPRLVVVEATGGLQRQVVAALWAAQIAVAVVNPAWVRHFAKGRGLRGKTDSIDADLLALYAERERPEPRPPADAETAALQALVMRREQLVEMVVAEEHRLQRATASLRKEIRHHISYLKGRIKDLEEDLDQTVRRSQSWRRKREVMGSAPGVGKVIFDLIIQVTNNQLCHHAISDIRD